MGDKSKIEWTDATWNPVVGCKHVHPGCENCYAEQHSARMARMGGKAGKRYAGLTVVGDDGRAKWTGVVREVPEVLDRPLRWRRPRRVFVNSMSDLFHADVSPEYIAAVFAVMAATPRHKYVILTKRPKRAREWFEYISEVATGWGVEPALFVRNQYRKSMHGLQWAAFCAKAPDPRASWPLPNVAIGVSVSDQRSADDLIPHLLEIPAAVRIVSAEPLLADVDLSRWLAPVCVFCEWRGEGDGRRPIDCPECYGVEYESKIDQVITGAESGKDARHCDIKHAQNLAADVLNSGVSLFVKQWTVCVGCHGQGVFAGPIPYKCLACNGTREQTGKLRKGCPVFYVPGHGAQSWAQMPEGWDRCEVVP